MKLDKVLCYRLLFAILGVDRAQNLTKYNMWLRVFMQGKTKDVHGRGPYNLNLGLINFSFDVCRAF